MVEWQSFFFQRGGGQGGVQEAQLVGGMPIAPVALALQQLQTAIRQHEVCLFSLFSLSPAPPLHTHTHARTQLFFCVPCYAVLSFSSVLWRCDNPLVARTHVCSRLLRCANVEQSQEKPGGTTAQDAVVVDVTGVPPLRSLGVELETISLAQV